MSEIRKGMPDVHVSRDEFIRRFRERFVDPRYESLTDAIDRITEVAWDAYEDKAMPTRTTTFQSTGSRQAAKSRRPSSGKRILRPPRASC